MDTTSTGASVPTEDDIRAWLIAHIAEVMGGRPEDIDIREPVESYGLSSREAVSMVGDLEDWLGRKISPTLVWEYPTIEAIAHFLDGRQTPTQASRRPTAVNPLKAQTTAADLAELSDEEAEALLLQKLTDLGQ